MNYFFLLLLPLFYCCNSKSNAGDSLSEQPAARQLAFTNTSITDTTSWTYFLQHLPEKEGSILDYEGDKIRDQNKHFSIINYDVGNRDLQQCADALMRLRAEYLFARRRFDEIGFHFVSGQYYRFTDYCKGLKPVPNGNTVRFVTGPATEATHQNLRKYLNLVYTYASTISLARELKTTNAFGIGTVVIYPGSPGHCFIIVDEAMTADGEKLFKLVEGYTPAQSIYVLRNNAEPALGYWHQLQKGTIETASYVFTSYQLKTFE
ncbi:MAG TPA: DUF4846 domain-containing protein [Flavisolibacter sp.]|jgi:hypothetical protein|nr:DUF4846 domain-containing protein [Flavisolibacter sp.]